MNDAESQKSEILIVEVKVCLFRQVRKAEWMMKKKKQEKKIK